MFDFLFGYSVDAILRSLSKCVERLEALQTRNSVLMQRKKEEIVQAEAEYKELGVEVDRAVVVAKNIKKLIGAE